MDNGRGEKYVTGGKMKGRKKVIEDITKGKSITEMITGRKEAWMKVTTEKAAGGINDQVDAKWRRYSEVVIEGGIESRKDIYGRLHFVQDRQDIKQGRGCCLSKVQDGRQKSVLLYNFLHNYKQLTYQLLYHCKISGILYE